MQLGVRLLRHSVAQVIWNMSAVLRISFPMLLAMAASALVRPDFAWLTDPYAGDLSNSGPQGGLWGVGPILIESVPLFAGLVLALYLSGLWTAVAWHRYVLTSEMPGALLPRFNGGRILAYFGRSLLLTLAAVPAVIVIMVLTFLFFFGGAMGGSNGSPAWLQFYNFLAFALIWWWVTRFSLVLPASALGEPMTLGGSWRATAKANGALLFLAFLWSAVSAVLARISPVPGAAGAVAGAFVQFVLGWAGAMIGISILTTLYGHLVEGRDLV